MRRCIQVNVRGRAGQAAVPGGGASLVLEAVLDAPLAISPKRGRTIWEDKSQGEGTSARLNSTRYWLDSPARGEADRR